MEKQKYERVEGSLRYVKMGNTVYDTVGKDATPTKVICECLNCGDRFGGDTSGKCAMYCKNCKTVDGRKKINEENAKLNNRGLNN